MDAIVIAGGIPQPEDPLYTYSKGDAKALIELAGKPMIQWVLDALNGASQVDNIILIGLSPKTEIQSLKPLHYVSNQGRMLANIVAGVNKALELNNETKYVMVVSADIPSIKAHMVDWLVTTAMQTKDELYYGVCPRPIMEKRFPGSKRTYTRLKDMEICGADINITHVRMASEHLEMWEDLIDRRKNPLSQAAAIGLGTAFLLSTGQLTLADAVERVCKRIGIKGRPIVWEYAEPAMDVDKPHQLELLRADLTRQVRRAEQAKLGPARKKKPKKKVLRRAKKVIRKKPARPKKRVAARRPVKKSARPKKRTSPKRQVRKTLRSKSRPVKKKVAPRKPRQRGKRTRRR